MSLINIHSLCTLNTLKTISIHTIKTKSKHCVVKLSYIFNHFFSSANNINNVMKIHPFNRRFAYSNRPIFPIEPRNIRIKGIKLRRKKRGRGDKGRGYRGKHQKGSSPNSRTWEGGKTPLYKRLPKWPESTLFRRKRNFDMLNLSKLRKYIEKGRIDCSYNITQRHIHDSGCCKVKYGIKLFNVNDYPFPYKIDIYVAGADQSSINAIKSVGGSVTIVYMSKVNLRAFIKPYKFEILPKHSRPGLESIHYLEKMKARGADVKYIKPLWLIEEEKEIKSKVFSSI